MGFNFNDIGGRELEGAFRDLPSELIDELNPINGIEKMVGIVGHGVDTIGGVIDHTVSSVTGSFTAPDNG